MKWSVDVVLLLQVVDLGPAAPSLLTRLFLAFLFLVLVGIIRKLWKI